VSPGEHHLLGVRRPTASALLLSAVAGYVDAYVFLRVSDVFIANQSGNLIVGGISAAGGEVGDVLLPFVSVLAYVLGAAAASAAFDRPDRSGRRRLTDTVAAVIVVLTGCAVALQLAGEGRAPAPRSALVAGVVAAAAAAMGAQATAIRRAGGVSVLTTASTGAITALGVELGRHRGSLDPAARARAGRLVALVLCYVGGAASGAALSVHTDRGPELLAVPCLALAALLIAQRAAASTSLSERDR
jgi:uncharacterized membrane protein YoaK (UPF0700 family)